MVARVAVEGSEDRQIASVQDPHVAEGGVDVEKFLFWIS